MMRPPGCQLWSPGRHQNLWIVLWNLGAAEVDLFDCFLGARIPINQLDDNKTSAAGYIERLNRKHSILLEDIDPEKSYYLRIRGHGEDGKEQVSQAYEFD